MISFQNSGFSYFLLAIFVIFLLELYLMRLQNYSLNKFFPGYTAKKIVVTNSNLSKKIKIFNLLLAWTLLTLSLMSPIGNFRTFLLTQNRSIMKSSDELIFVIDSSASMAVVDTGEQASRLDKAKKIALKALNSLQNNRQAIEVAIYAFTKILTPLSPMTYDYLFSHMILQNIQINEGDLGGTDLVQMWNGLEASQNSTRHANSRKIVILTDGDVEEDKGKLSKLTKFRSTDVFIIGIGNKKPSIVPNISSKPLSAQNIHTLKLLAQNVGGNYIDANNMPVDDVVQKLNLTDTSSSFSKEMGELPSITTSSNYFQLPLAMAIIILLFNCNCLIEFKAR